MYWWRARVGAIVVSDNVISECDYWRMAPQGVSVHAARMRIIDSDQPVERLAQMAPRARLAAEDLATLSPDVVVYACTSGSFFQGRDWEKNYMRELGEVAGCEVLSTAYASILALQSVGARKVSVATPYTKEINELLPGYFADCGVEIDSLVTADLHSSADVHRLSPETIYQLIMQAATDDSQAVFFACTAVPALDVIELAEQDLGRPVITANQATFWAALRVAGIRDSVSGFGELLRRDLVP